MPTATVAGALGELRGGTAVGESLSTTAVFTQIPTGVRHVFLTPRNLSTAVVVRVAVGPYLTIFKTADAMATATDYSENAQDGSVSTDVTLSSLDTLANGDAVYIGAGRPFRGLAVDVDSANGNASVLSAHYWNGSAWTTLTPTDGTDAAGATFGQDGNITWTVPTAWVQQSLTRILGLTPVIAGQGNRLFWARLSVSAALDSSTTQNSILGMAASTNYFSLVANQNFELQFNKKPGRDGNIEALTDAGTANLVIDYAAGDGAAFL